MENAEAEQASSSVDNTDLMMKEDTLDSLKQLISSLK